MAHIHSLISEVPKYVCSQMEFYEHIAPRIDSRFHNIFQRILKGSQIKKRHFSIPVEEMVALTEEKRIGDKFRIWKEVSFEFFHDQCERLLEDSGLRPDEIDGLCFNTTSGFITPNVDILIQDSLGLRRDIIRLPLFGFGCSGGMAALNRVNDILKAMPDKAFLVCIGETLSTQYETADSTSVLVANSLFGDGYATLLMVGSEHRLAKESQVEILGTESHLFKDCDFAVGQWMTEEGINTHVDNRLPQLVKNNAAKPVNKFFDAMGKTPEDVDYFIMHAGGPRVTGAFGEAVGIPKEKLELTLETFRLHGNQASVSVITALDRALKQYKKPGLGYMMALGPGVHLESALCMVTPNANTSAIHSKVEKPHMASEGHDSEQSSYAMTMTS